MDDRKLEKIIRRHLISAFARVSLFVTVTAFFFTCVFGVATIETNDMYPAVVPGDLVFYYRLGELKRQDVVVYGENAGVGRIQAAESDIVDTAEKGELTINGFIQPVQMGRGLYYETFRKEGASVRYPVRVGADEYFLLGDKRDSAADSRTSGAIDKKEIRGKIVMILRRRTI